MYKLLGIEFAPLNIPLSRRLQTAAVLAYVFMFLQGLSTLSFTLFFMLLFFTPFFWVSLLYAAFYVYDFKTPQIGGRFNMSVRRWRIWKHLADYFPVELVKTADLDPNKNYIMGISPHSVMCFSAMSAFGTEALGFSDRFPGITPHLVTLNQQFFSPITRELNLALGILSANRDSLKYVLSNRGVCKNKGQTCIILIGGARESLESYPGRYPLIIKNRKGFVRIALETGANLVPVFVFGENDVYNTLEVEKGSKLRKFQEWVKSWSQFGLPIIRGRGIFNYTFGLIPYRKPTFVVVGKPIDVKKVEHPSQQQVDELHDLYVKSLIELFNEHKHKYCKNKDIQLEFL